MSCPACGAENRDGARFCGECAAPLGATTACESCGVQNLAGRKFCDACGTPLAARPEAGGGAQVVARPEAAARKIVTIVFADLAGSTALHERLDAESVRVLMDRYYAALRSVIEAHDGAVVKLLGDGVMAAFGVPRVREDDALRAVRAAVAMQRACRALAAEQAGAARDITLRVAVNTGEVVVSADHSDVVGDPVNVAARLQQEARDGEVLVGESTRRLVADSVTLAPFGSLALKGRTGSVEAHRVVSLARPVGTTTAFVGREDELRRLTAVYDAAVAAPASRLVTVLGSPGLGKSRLLAELVRRLTGDGAIVVAAQCDATAVATFAPLADALRTLLEVDDGAAPEAVRAAVAAVVAERETDRDRIAAGIARLLGAAPAPPEETFFVLRRLLASIARTKPVVLAIDDVQWAEPLLLDFIEHLIQWGAGVPLLVLAAARPELRDTRAPLTTPGGLVSDVVVLGGLAAGAATRLAANVIGAAELPAAVVGRVLAASEGNPLFVGELVRMLVHDGALKRDGDRWTTGVEVARLDMPPTIQALLAARIERLRAEERIVIERAAVIGRQFSRAALEHLLPPDLRADLDARLASLRRSELIDPDAGWLLGEPVLRFHHALIRDAAYRRVLKGTRAELHARFAAWLESRAGESVEHDETIGWHLEQAHQHLCELGPVDAHGRALGERAASHLGAAGRRALARDDMAVAAGLFGRAVDRLDGDDPARADLALDWCEALLAGGAVATATRAIAELARFIDRSQRLRAWHTCFVGQLAALTDPQALRTTVDAVAAAAQTLAGEDDAAGEAKAHFVHATALARLGDIGASETALDRALAAARRAHDRRRANGVLAGAPVAALSGPSPVARASGRCLDVVRVLRITQGSPTVEAVALRCQAVLEALRGRGDAARRMLASSRRMVEELGVTQRLLEADMAAGLIALLEGDVAGAEASLRIAYDGLRAHGLRIDAAQAAALLGRALLALGRDAEAEALTAESEALAGDDLKAAIAWRGVRAEALARRGEHAAAIELAHAAVAIASATDALLDHADARRALAVALRAAGRNREADAEDARVLELWEAKGATLLAERGRRADAKAAAGPDVAAEPLGATRAFDDDAAPRAAVARRVRPNAATTQLSRFDAAMAARDVDGIAEVLTGLHEVDHHLPTDEVAEESIRWFQQMAGNAIGLSYVHEHLATLGDRLCVSRARISLAGLADEEFLFGASIVEPIVVVETDAAGARPRIDIFADDRLADAIVRLYERHADLLDEGPMRHSAAARARTVTAILTAMSIDTVASTFAPHVEFVDHRPVGLPALRGRDAYVRAFRSLLDAVSEFANRGDDVIALRPDGVLLRVTNYGTERSNGGVYERPMIVLATFDDRGLVTHWEFFSADHDGEALARFDELTADEHGAAEHRAPASRSAAAIVAPAAVAAAEHLERAWESRDWQRYAALHAASLRVIDRRKLVQLELDRDQFLDSYRQAFDFSASMLRCEVLATRGRRHTLLRNRWHFAHGDVGPSEIERLSVSEVDDRGLVVRIVTFDVDDIDAAYAELDDSYAAGEAREHGVVVATARAFARAFAARDWQALVATFREDVLVEDHRVLGWDALRGPAAYVRTLEALTDLSPDVRMRVDHVETSGRALLWVAAWLGTHAGGGYETPWIVVSEHDAGGLVRRVDQYDLEQLAAARARFEALRPRPDVEETFRR